MKQFINVLTTLFLAAGFVIWSLANAVGNTQSLRSTDEMANSVSAFAALMLSAIVPMGIAIFLTTRILKTVQNRDTPT